jgi:hypothetical protein
MEQDMELGVINRRQNDHDHGSRQNTAHSSVRSLEALNGAARGLKYVINKIH